MQLAYTIIISMFSSMIFWRIGKEKTVRSLQIENLSLDSNPNGERSFLLMSKAPSFFSMKEA